VDLTDSRIKLGLNHGYETGDAVTYSSNGSTSIGGLINGSTYYVIAKTEDDSSTTYNDLEWVKLARTKDEADSSSFVRFSSLPASNNSVNLMVGSSSGTAGADVATNSIDCAVVNFTNVLNETNSLVSTTPASQSLTFVSDHGLATGDRVLYKSSNGLRIRGVESATNSLTFGSVAISGVDQSANTLSFASAHNLQAGDQLVYNFVGGNIIAGLTSGTTYSVIYVDALTIKLALPGSATTPIDLTGTGFAGTHELLVAH
jgi:hypothetical protein